MNIIIDTNLWISFLIGKKLSAIRTLFTNSAIKIYVCDELLDEFTNVSSRLKIRKYITEDDVQETIKLIDRYCYYVPIINKVVYPIRDKKDLYLLSLAETVPIDFILTGDKYLLSLHSYNQTRIVTYQEFSAIIGDKK
ncbi:MAG: putative toxin-antitoxin system toxin component, PIN family [Marinilabiliaceae bacterium]|nr:putative toxin-antitoxin system toxin component, PIN family [Marinilabiliaceae bacterium]